MADIVKVLGDSSVYIGQTESLLGGLLPENRRVIVITDKNIEGLKPDLVGGFDSIVIESDGERGKSLHTVEGICRKLLEMGADRTVFLLGVGGGVVSDITGFTASIYMRGVDFGFVSTTLLSQVDAGVGGKNGVNLDGYKNIIGCFNQPSFVVCDIEILNTLNDREFRSGLAELIKAAIIADKELFAHLEKTTFEQLRSDKNLLSKLLKRVIEIKAEIVSRDEREKGERRLLNLGHTYAHAIEKLSDKLNHGEAVAVGIVIAARKSIELGLLSNSEFERIEKLLSKFDFELTSPVEISELEKILSTDKKCEGGQINFVLINQIGKCEVRKLSIR